MATGNPFDLLGDDDSDDLSHLISAAQAQLQKAAAAATVPGGKKSPAGAAAPAAAKMPAKPVPPSQAVREARSSINGPPRGATGRGGPARGRGGRGAGIGQNRDFGNSNENGFTGGYGGGAFGMPEEGEAGKMSERNRGGYGPHRQSFGMPDEGDGGKSSERNRGGYGPPRQSYRGGHRGGYGNVDGDAGGDTERPPRRVYERRSGTGRGYEMKREGAGRGNWGTVTDDIAQEEENVNADEKLPEKQTEQEDVKPAEGDKEKKEDAAEEETKEEDKEMTLEEYEKVREEKRKALLAMKAEERKVVIDEELQSMQPLKKANEDIFIKLGSEKESKRRENADREERVKKSLSINEFLNRYVGPSFEIPPASLAVFMTLSMLVSVVLYDRYFVKIVKKWTKNPRGLTLLQRIGVGILLHIVSMMVASLTETRRLSVARSHGLVQTGGQVPLTIFLLIPQFVLMGVSDAFYAVGKIEFFYDQAPESMKSLGTSYALTAFGIGNFLSSFLLSAVSDITSRHGKGWVLNNLNASHLDYYYGFLCILALLNFVFFLFVSKYYTYKAEVFESVDALHGDQNATNGTKELCTSTCK